MKKGHFSLINTLNSVMYVYKKYNNFGFYSIE